MARKKWDIKRKLRGIIEMEYKQTATHSGKKSHLWLVETKWTEAEIGFWMTTCDVAKQISSCVQQK